MPAFHIRVPIRVLDTSVPLQLQADVPSKVLQDVQRYGLCHPHGTAVQFQILAFDLTCAWSLQPLGDSADELFL